MPPHYLDNASSLGRSEALELRVALASINVVGVEPRAHERALEFVIEGLCEADEALPILSPQIGILWGTYAPTGSIFDDGQFVHGHYKRFT